MESWIEKLRLLKAFHGGGFPEARLTCRRCAHTLCVGGFCLRGHLGAVAQCFQVSQPCISKHNSVSERKYLSNSLIKIYSFVFPRQALPWAASPSGEVRLLAAHLPSSHAVLRGGERNKPRSMHGQSDECEPLQFHYANGAVVSNGACSSIHVFTPLPEACTAPMQSITSSQLAIALNAALAAVHSSKAQGTP